MPTVKQSDRVRDIVIRHYVGPALQAGSAKLSIRAGDVLKYAEATDSFPRGRTPLVCNVLQSRKLLDEAGLEIESVDGPPSRQSRKVVVHYRFADAKRNHRNLAAMAEAPAERAHRLTEKLRGLLKNELAEYGGAEGFIRWVRSEGDEDAE
jgi:hypothetical protein